MSVEKNNSIVEQTLLQIKAVEDAISENAKGILASTMKQEISELVKESLNDSKKRKKSLYEQTEDPNAEDEVEDETEDDMDVEPDGDEEVVDVDVDMDDDLEGDDEEVDTDVEVDTEMMPVGDNEMAPLDMTNASPDEVLKVFKAMGDEDGIIVKKDGNFLHLSDTSTNKDYMIQTENDKRRMNMKRKRINEFRSLDDMPLGRRHHDDEEDEYELSFDDEFELPKRRGSKYSDEMEETIYELELDEQTPPATGGTQTGTTQTASPSYTSQVAESTHLYSDYIFETSEPKLGKPSFKYSNKPNMEDGFDEEMKEAPKRYGKGGSKYKQNQYPKSLKRGVTENEYDLEEKWLDEEDLNDVVEMDDHEDGETKEAARTMTYRRRAERNRVTAPKQVRKESVNKELNLLREKNEEYKKALDFFRNKLNEVAVFNANLAYSTRLFTEHSTTKQEKINILRRFDSVETIKESKNLYQSIKKELDGKGGNEVVTESIQRKVTKTPQSGSATNLIESKTYENPQFLRMKDLMAKIN